MTARYPFPWDLLARLAVALPRGRADLSADAAALVSRLEPRPTIETDDTIPERGPLVVAANHYQRRGLWIGWAAAIITCALRSRRGQDPPVHWLVTGGLRWRQWENRGPVVPFSGAMFSRVAAGYGMAALSLSDARARSSALSQWLRWIRSGDAGGIFPEGLRGSSQGIVRPEPGFEDLCRILSKSGIPVLPCGIREEDDRLVVAFGQCIGPDMLSRRGAGDLVMSRIGSLLHADQRGPYGG